MKKQENYYDVAAYNTKEVRRQGIILRVLLVVAMASFILNGYRSYRVDHRLIPLQQKVNASCKNPNDPAVVSPTDARIS